MLVVCLRLQPFGDDAVQPVRRQASSSTVSEEQLSQEELTICKVLLSQTKDPSNFEKSVNEANAILRTLATRLVQYKEASSIGDFILKKTGFDPDKQGFALDSRLNQFILQLAREAIKDPSKFAWEDKDCVFWSVKGWRPSEEDMKHFTWKVKYASDNYEYWDLTPKATLGFDFNGMSLQEKFLARVIYSETSTICTPLEVKLVCKVIMNRIGRKDFGQVVNGKLTAPGNAYDVVRVRNAFSCINDKGNSNWNSFKPTLNSATQRDSVYAAYMMKGDQKTIQLPDEYKDIVYYHDKSIECPRKWTNRYWKPVLVIETEHFKFYKIVPNTHTT